MTEERSQSLFYWIIYSYHLIGAGVGAGAASLNPYFTGLSILITFYPYYSDDENNGLNPYFTGLSILICPAGLLKIFCNACLNPYFTGLSILIR